MFLDLLDALERRIAEVDPKVNALPTLCLDRARQHAKALMAKPPGQRGRLGGMPIPIKDLTDVEGVRDGEGHTRAQLTIAEAQELIATGVAVGGMQAKLESAMSALRNGVGQVRIAPGARVGIVDALLAGEAAGTRLISG